MKPHHAFHPLPGGFFALLIAALLSACAQAPASREPRAPATVTKLAWSGDMPEDAHDFKCQTDEVMVGRFHKGAEDKPTRYRCATVFQYKDIPISDVREIDRFGENHGVRFVCPRNEVMVGRGHLDDENGDTWYYCGKPHDYWDNPLNVVPDNIWIRIDDEEQAGEVECSTNKVMIGRWHDGDETKATEYLCATLY